MKIRCLTRLLCDRQERNAMVQFTPTGIHPSNRVRCRYTGSPLGVLDSRSNRAPQNDRESRPDGGRVARRIIICDGLSSARLWSRIGADEDEVLTWVPR